jgi:hypothetical protein
MARKDEETRIREAALKALLAQPVPDLQLPPESLDTKTGLDFNTVYPSKDGALPPESTMDPETGLDFTKAYASPDGTLPPDIDADTGLDFNKFYAATSKPQPVKADTFVGPPQKQPWHAWSSDQTAKVDGLLKQLDAAKLFQGSGGRVGDPAAFAKVLQEGGLTEDQALTLARYRMSKMDNPGDVPNTPQRTPEDTKQQIEARNAAFFAAKPEDRKAMLTEQKARGFLTNEGFYDTLVPKQATMASRLPATSDNPSDDERLTNAQLQMLFQLAGRTH